MPTRNVIKQFDAPAYYHVYNRGAGGQAIFGRDKDKIKFLSLFERHLVPTENSLFPVFDVTISAYCIMDNHFHLLVFLPHDPAALTQLMRSVSTAYAMYYNHTYKQQGHVFQSVFKASHVSRESYLTHISRYIHLNPTYYRSYKWSSLSAYLNKTPAPEWLDVSLALSMAPAQYLQFLEDAPDRRLQRKELSTDIVF